MELTTPRLNIRFVRETDWPDLIRIWDDFGRSEYARYDVPHTATEAEAREKARSWTEVSPGMEHMFFAVCLDGEMIGYADFHKTGDGYECGYCFHSDFHGKGYAGESLQALLKELAGGRRTRFTAGTALQNIRSVRLLHSLGFVKTGEEPVSFYQDENGEDVVFTGGVFALDVNGEGNAPFIRPDP